jgi:hypothetical protein
MRKLKVLCLAFLLATIGLLGLISPVHAEDDVVIKNFKIDMVVDENGKITVEQTMDYQFNISTSHGAVIFLPENYSMQWTIDGETYDRDYYFPVRNIGAGQDPIAEIVRENGYVTIYIGDEDVYVPMGLKVYTLTYTIQMRDLDLEGYQAFYMNLVGQYWEDRIENVEFSITLPKPWPSDITFYGGIAGNNTPLDLQYTVVGNTLSGTYDQGISYGQALTVFSELPNDFFTFIPAADYSIPALMFAIAMSVLVLLAFFKFGKDDRPVETVEFNAIPGLSSAQVGFIFDGFVDSRDVLSLIIEWASKGYLTITETGKSGFTLTKLMDIPQSEIRAERTLFNALFMGRTEVTNKQLENTFYMHLQHAQADIQRHFQGNKSRNIYRKASTAMKFILGVVSVIPIYLVLAALVYVDTYMVDMALGLPIILLVCGIAFNILFSILRQKWISLRLVSRIGAGLGLAIFALVVISVLLGIFIWIQAPLWILVVLLGLLTFNALLISVMDKRTPLGTEYLGRIIGLKRFIEVAEKDKLEMLVKDDPEYFYKILPYAYVLNVSDVWSKKFESIAIPQPSWYVGSNPMNSYLFMRSLNHTLGNMNRSMTSVPRAKGGGSIGGGGGGFSGGGFGGGGGGHW